MEKSRIFFVGDLKGNNGPASVNKALQKIMPKSTLYSEERMFLKRIIELFIKIRKTDGVVFSGLSKVNIIGFILAKFLGKKSAYLMHGNVNYEDKINQRFNNKNIVIENKILKLAPIIICVSENFMNWMKDNYPQYRQKLKYVNNGVDWDLIEKDTQVPVERRCNRVLSIGGGMRRKNIIAICEAIEILNKNDHTYYELVVIGANDVDTKKIKSYPFVTYIENVNKDEMPLYYKSATLYIQNSVFETFGLAPIEALICGCNLLISNNVGAKGIFNTLEDNDLINNVNDVEEIVRKITYNIHLNNNNRLMSMIDRESTSVKASYTKLLKVLFEQK